MAGNGPQLDPNDRLLENYWQQVYQKASVNRRELWCSCQCLVYPDRIGHRLHPEVDRINVEYNSSCDKSPCVMVQQSSLHDVDNASSEQVTHFLFFKLRELMVAVFHSEL